MLWKMLQELGYEKIWGITGLKWRMKDLKSFWSREDPWSHVWQVQVYVFTPKPLRGVFEVEKIHGAIAPRHNFYAGIFDATRQAYMVTRSHHRQLLDGMDYAHFPQWAIGSAYIHVEQVPDSRNFKLKKQVELTSALTKELDSTTEEVGFWQEKYEEVMKTIRKLKRHCPQGVQTLSMEETEVITLASPPRKMATCAPPVYVIPNNDDD
jgi:hypothetical protein